MQPGPLLMLSQGQVNPEGGWIVIPVGPKPLTTKWGHHIVGSPHTWTRR